MPDRLNINSKELDLNYIKGVLQQIVNKTFTDPRRREIVLRPNDSHVKEFNICCPLCGDSHDRPTMKRGHLFTKNLYYVCYNEREIDSMSFTKFCKRFNIEIDMDKKMEIYNYLDNNWKYEKKEDFVIDNMDKLIDLEEFFKTLNSRQGSFLNGVHEIVPGSIFHKYLTDRKIYNFENIRQGYYHITSKWTEPVIVILNRTADKLLGMQLRNLKSEKTKRIYKFCSFQEIYNLMHPEDPLDEIEAVQYNKASSIFNMLNIDYDNTIYVFEGYLDSVFFPNSIALVGLDTDISVLSDANLDLRFVLDTDEAGQRKAKEMIDENYSVFLWKRLFNDLSKGKGSKFKYHLESNIKDINKLAEFYDDQGIYSSLKLGNYFAKDPFDLIDM